MASHSPKILNARQRKELTRIPENLESRDIAHHYTLLPDDIALINEQHSQSNRLGFAVQLCVLRFPGRALVDLPGVPEAVLDYIAEQINVPPDKFAEYGQRANTVSEHLTKLRLTQGFRDYGWSEMLQLARRLLPLAMEIDERVPLVEAALEHLRETRVVAPAIGSIEALVWQVIRIARRRIYRRLEAVLTPTQRELLDACLQTEPGLKRKIRLQWLRARPKAISKQSLNHLVERVKYVKLLQLPALPLDVHPHRVRLLARRCKQYSPSLLKSMKRKNPHRYYATLLAYLTEFSKDKIDQTVDMFDALIEEMLRRADRAQEQHLKEHARAMHENVMTLTDAAEAFLKAHDEQLEPFATVFNVVSKVKLKATIQSVRQLARPRDLDVVDLMEKRYVAKRKAFLHFYQSLLFEPALDSHPALTALSHIVLLKDMGNRRVRERHLTIGKRTWSAPLEFLQHTRWLKHALVGATKINPNFYEAGAFDRLRHGLRSGDIAVIGSRRYQDFNSYLLSVADFRRLREQGLTRLALTGSAQDYITTMQPRIATGFADIERSLPTNTAWSFDEEGNMHLSSLEGAVTPPMRAFRRYWYQWLPRVQLTDLLLEVDAWTGFLDRLVHHTSHRGATGEDKLALVTALVALATNLGMEKMAQASAFSQNQLDKAVDGRIREETLLAAQGVLDSFMLRLPISSLWGDGTFSSSDGLRFSMGVNAPNAVYNSRYFGTRRGLTVITHLADIGVPIGKQPVISTNDREALYVIDALCHHDTELNLDTHTTDTGGSTYHVFALCAMLGYHFVPHLRSLTEQYLFSAYPMAVPAPFADLFQGPIDVALLERNWDDLLRLATSIRHGVVPASLIMRKLRSYSRQNELSRALNEMGKLERTAFILDYLLDETLRRRVRVALNRGESLHALARALFFGQLGQFHDRDLQEQMHRASSLMLLIAAISVWNAVYLQKALDAMRAANITVDEEYLRHTFPLGWSHINFFGKYAFDLGQTYSIQHLRPLRAHPNIDPLAA
jgi:TnpA family transposase